MKSQKIDHPVSEAGGPGYERRDANPNMLFMIGGGLIVLILVVMFVIIGILKIFNTSRPTGEPPPPATAEAHVVPPEPRLQINPEADYKRLLAEEDSVLGTYGWVDRAMGIARIPIDTAISIVVARELPFRAQTPAPRENTQSGGGRNPQ